MSKAVSDHFSAVAPQYADSRPTYPAALFAWLADQCEEHSLAWDCGAGNGQASIALARFFARVIATDASEAQIALAAVHPSVEYRVAPAQSSGLGDACADLATVAQALHWFDFERFYAEANRVLKPGGVLAAWSYGVLNVEGDEVDSLVQDFYRNDIGSYWPPERRHVETGYRLIELPFPGLVVPTFGMHVRWDLGQLLGYLRSWSATARFIKAMGSDPVTALEAKLRRCWGDAERRRLVEWPLAILAGRKARG